MPDPELGAGDTVWTKLPPRHPQPNEQEQTGIQALARFSAVLTTFPN